MATSGQPQVWFLRIWETGLQNLVDISDYALRITIPEGIRQPMQCSITLKPHVWQVLKKGDSRYVSGGQIPKEYQTLFQPTSGIIFVSLPDGKADNWDFIGLMTLSGYEWRVGKQTISRNLTVNCNSLASEIMSKESRYFASTTELTSFLANEPAYTNIIKWLKDATINATAYHTLEDLVSYCFETTSAMQNVSFGAPAQTVKKSNDTAYKIRDFIDILVRSFPGDRFIMPGFYNYQGKLTGMIDSLVEPSLYYHYDTVINGRSAIVVAPFPYDYRNKTYRDKLAKGTFSPDFDDESTNPPLPRYQDITVKQVLSRFWDEPNYLVDIDEDMTAGGKLTFSDSELFTVHSTRAATDVSNMGDSSFVFKNIYNLPLMRKYGIRLRETNINSISINPDEAPLKIPKLKDKGIPFAANPDTATYKSVQFIKRNLLYRFYGYPFYGSGTLTIKRSDNNPVMRTGQRIRLNQVLSEKGNPMQAMISGRTRDWEQGQSLVDTYSLVRIHDPEMVIEFFDSTANETYAGEYFTSKTIQEGKNVNEPLLNTITGKQIFN